jgi:riboflavin kinase / FMN adenylyltransferase
MKLFFMSLSKMKLIENLNEITTPFQSAVITIGNFDGVHIGHQALFHETVQKAHKIGGTAIAMTFEPHPARVLGDKNGPPLITLYEQKIELITRVGLDVLIVVPFTKEFSELTAGQFVEDLLVNKIGTKAIVVGKDYTYGKNREGNLSTLQANADRLNLKVIVVGEIPLGAAKTDRISSTKIRELVMDGRMKDAHKLLGRFYQIRGTVVTGRKRGGKLLGCPTANIELQDELRPKMGVYAVTVECLDGRYKGVANIGYSPTFDDHIFTVEVHLLDFNDDLYNKKIKVNFVERIRDEKKFSGIDELSEQIKLDIQTARETMSI